MHSLTGSHLRSKEHYTVLNHLARAGPSTKGSFFIKRHILRDQGAEVEPSRSQVSFCLRDSSSDNKPRSQLGRSRYKARGGFIQRNHLTGSRLGCEEWLRIENSLSKGSPQLSNNKSKTAYSTAQLRKGAPKPHRRSQAHDSSLTDCIQIKEASIHKPLLAPTRR